MMASGRFADYLGMGVIGDRPAAPVLLSYMVGLWYSTDTLEWSAWNGSVWLEDIMAGSGGTGVVETIVAGTGITVDSTDPANPIVAATGGGTGTVDSVVGGTGIDVDATDPANPIANLDSASIASLALADSALQDAPSDGTTYGRKDAAWVATTGSGDVVGPASAVDGHVALFDGTSGKLLKDGGLPATDRSTVTAVTPASGTATFDYSLGDYFTLAPTANVTTLAFSNLPGAGHGASLIILFTQDSSPRTVAWPASFKWAGGVAPAVSTGSGAVDLLAITTLDNGTTWDATLAKAFA